jgi:integrase
MARHDSKDQKGRWPLLEAGYAKRTSTSYKKAVCRFSNWCKISGQSADSYDELDELVADYIQSVYDQNGGTGAGKQLARDVLNGIQMYLPRAKGKMPTAARMVNRWSAQHLPESYPPLTWELAVVIGIQLVRNGFKSHGLAVLLMFDCLLRIGEMSNLTRKDVAFPGDARMGVEYKRVTLALNRTKTGRFQSVEVRDHSVIRLLAEHIRGLKPHDLLFPGGPTNFRRRFKSVCTELGLSPTYVPHSLRHGGATRLHLLGWPIEDILMRGRWKSHKSARTYIQSSKAMLMAQRVPESVQIAAQALVKDIYFSFSLAQKH